MFRRLAIAFLLLWALPVCAKEHDYSGAWLHPAIPAAREIAAPPITLIRANQINLGDVFAFTGNNTHSGTESFSNTVTVTGALNANGGGALNGSFSGPTTLTALTNLDNVRAIDGVNLTLASVLAAPTANTTYWITANASFPTSDQTLSVANVTFLCFNGAKITRTTPNALITTGANFQMYGCIWDGGSLATMKQALVIENSAIVQFNTFQNYTGTGGSSGNGIVAVFNNVSPVFISKNTITNIRDHGIFGQDNAVHVVVDGNSVDTTNAPAGVHDIVFHSTSVGTAPSDVTITGNILRNGSGFCIELGNFGGNNALDFAVTGNKCKLSAAAGGGYSFSGASNFTASGNVFDSNGFAFSIVCIEAVVAINDGSITGNTCNDGTNGDGISVDRAVRLTVAANDINGFKTTTTDFGIKVVVSATASPSASDNVIANNIINFPAAGSGFGIWQQCNATGATCNNNTYEGNHIIGTGAASSTGIQLEHDAGTSSDSNHITGNTIVNVLAGIVNGNNVTGTFIGPNSYKTVTTPVSGGGTTSVYVSSVSIQGTLTLKKGSGAGNYTNATTSYTVADSANLCFTVTIPTGWKLGVSVSGALSTATAAVVAQAALTDNAACSTANAGILTETAPIQGAGIGIADAFALDWVITGDGAAHNIALQFKTSNAADTASLINSSATIIPTMKFELMPSN